MKTIRIITPVRGSYTKKDTTYSVKVIGKDIWFQDLQDGGQTSDNFKRFMQQAEYEVIE